MAQPPVPTTPVTLSTLRPFDICGFPFCEALCLLNFFIFIQPLYTTGKDHTKSSWSSCSFPVQAVGVGQSHVVSKHLVSETRTCCNILNNGDLMPFQLSKGNNRKSKINSKAFLREIMLTDPSKQWGVYRMGVARKVSRTPE